MSFDDFGLSENILRAVRESGYLTPTPIQTEAIPVALMGRDILGCAQTGTGKTASFVLPMIEALSTGRSRARMPRALILEPTRELAAQVAENFEKYGKYLKLNHALLIGGEFMTEQLKTLERGVDVLIATPGRLIDMFERGKILMGDVKIFVIDESDRMLDMGFIPDVEKIASLLPPLRQTMLFSATMPPEIKRLADRFLMNPKAISVAPPASPAETVQQRKLHVQPRDKRTALRRIMQAEEISNAIVFCNRKRDVDVLVKSLRGHDINAAALHGDMVQYKRTETLDRFKKGEVHILVASDVAARGLDIVTVSHVFNFDVPYHADDYIHRIGRTGRAGRSGKSFTLVTDDDAKSLAAIERMLHCEIPTLDLDMAGAEAEREAANDDRPSRRRESKREPRRESGRETGRDSGRDGVRGQPEEATPRGRSRRSKAATAERLARPEPQPDAPAAPAEARPAPRAERQPAPRAERQPVARAEAPPPTPRAEPRPGPRAEPRRGRRTGRVEDAADIPGPQAFGEDNTPAFLLRPSRDAAAG